MDEGPGRKERCVYGREEGGRKSEHTWSKTRQITSTLERESGGSGAEMSGAMTPNATADARTRVKEVHHLAGQRTLRRRLALQYVLS